MNKNQNQVTRTFFLISQISITMIFTIFLCVVIGMAVDKFFGTNILWVFIILGVLAGFNSVSIIIKRFVSFENNETTDYYKQLAEAEKKAREKKDSSEE